MPTPPGPYTLGPDSQRPPGVPHDVVTKHKWRSTNFLGTNPQIWIAVAVYLMVAILHKQLIQ